MKTIATFQFIQFVLLWITFDYVFVQNNNNSFFVIGQQEPILCPVCGGDFNQEMTLLDTVVSLAFFNAPDVNATCGEIAEGQTIPRFNRDQCDIVIGETALQDTCGCRLSADATPTSVVSTSPTNSPAFGQVPTSPTIAPGTTTTTDIPTSISPAGISGPPIIIVTTGQPIIPIPTITPKPQATNRPSITFQPTTTFFPTNRPSITFQPTTTFFPTSSTDSPAIITVPTTFTPAPILVTAVPILPTATPILITAAPVVTTLQPVLPTIVPTPTITVAPVVVIVPTIVPQPQAPTTNISPQNIPPSRRKPENSSQRVSGSQRPRRLQ